MDEWINKLWYMYTMEYYAPMKSNESYDVDIPPKHYAK